MPEPKCQSDPATQFVFEGFVGDYLERVTEQWLLVAPLANPAMLEMFTDRDVSPGRDLVPWAGEFAGKYLTSAVEVLRVTHNPQLESWLAQFVAKLLSLQAGDGYLGPWPLNSRLANHVGTGTKRRETWDTWGHYHIMLGLIRWYEYSQDPAALAGATKIADLLCARYLGDEVSPRLVETGNTDKNLAPVHSLCRLYRHRPEQRYLDMALQIVEEFSAEGPDGPIAGDYLRQALAGKAFWETPKPRWESLHSIMGLAELYWLTDHLDFSAAYQQLWFSIFASDRHNNGGFTSGEKATGNPCEPGAIESCCTIAWMALSVEMLKLDGNTPAADELELSTFNSVLGMHSCTGRWATYDTPMDGYRRAAAHQIVFQSRPGSPELNCCSVNSPRGLGLLGDWAVVQEEGAVLLNYYGPSQFTVPLGDEISVELRQDTAYPLADTVLLELRPSKPVMFTLKLRIPFWSQDTKVQVNGRAVEDVRPGAYLPLRYCWGTSDQVLIQFDFAPHFLTGEEPCAGLTSVYRGPLLLAYDQRYNHHRASAKRPQVIPEDAGNPFDRKQLPAPKLDARELDPHVVEWDDWLPPLLLLEVTGTDGEPVYLCDFASAGETGTPYVTWLPVQHVEQAVEATVLQLTRDSVCAGDDVDAPHAIELDLGREAAIESVLAAITRECRLPQIASGEATWSLWAGEQPLAVLAQQWPAPRCLVAPEMTLADLNGDVGNVFGCHLRYHAQEDPEEVTRNLQARLEVNAGG